MAELDFERGLERMFAEAPPYSDAETFAQGVERRLDRGWVLRRGLIGVAGGVGGVIGASQMLLTNVTQRVQDASEGADRLLQAGKLNLSTGLNLLSLVQSDGMVVWIAAGLAIVAMGFVLSRVIEEI